MARVKAKREFCSKPVKASKMHVLSDALFLAKPLRRWKFIGNLKCLHKVGAVSKIMTCSGGFHEAVRPILLIAQCFGVMPLLNITSKCPSSLKFSWKSFRAVFTIFVMLSCLGESIFAVYWTFSTHVEFGKMVILVFYITNFLSFFCFFKLAAKWPTLMMNMHEVEKKLPQFRTSQERQKMSKKIRYTSAIILLMSAIEHILSIISSVAVVLDCPKIKNIVKAYYVHNFPQIFSFFQFNHALGIYVKFIHVTSTFVWSFADLFIICVSCGLSARFKQINERMLETKGKVSQCACFVCVH